MIALLFLMQTTKTHLTDFGSSNWQSGFDRAMVNRSIGRTPLVVNGQVFANGIGAHASGGASFDLDGKTNRIEGSVAINDTGKGGTVEFTIWGDYKKLWSSGIIRSGAKPTPFSVDLSGVKQLTLINSDGGDGNGEDHANWLDVMFHHAGAKPKSVAFTKPLALLITEERQVMSNFGASDSWTVEPLIHWSESKRKEVARLLFDKKTGAGLSSWRHNLGGGLNDTSITMGLRQVDGYDAGEGKFDFTKVPGQRWMLQSAKEYGVEHLVAYAVSPPKRLTRNGLTNCTDGLGSTNLQENAEKAFAKFLVGAVQHFKKQGYNFTHISPINEPDYEWNGVPNASTQEGCRASNDDLVRITTAVAKEAKATNTTVRVVTPEATSPYIGYQGNANISKKYGQDYGNYSKMFSTEKQWVNEVNPVYGYHSYFVEKIDSMRSVRAKLGESLKKAKVDEIWMTEFCHLQGPGGAGGSGRDLGMTTALNMARLMQLDITLVGAAGWQWWLGVSDADFKDGLIYVDDLYQTDGAIMPSKSLWVMGQFARFVRPGYRRIDIQGPFDDVSATLVSAYKNPATGELVAILVNPDTQGDNISLSAVGKYSVKGWITSDRAGHDVASYPVKSLSSIRIPSRSVVTLVLTPKT